MNAAQELADLRLRDPDNQSHRLGDFWKDKKTVLVFVRHYG
jgi:hypothetical protein